MPSDLELERDLARAATRAASHSSRLVSGLVEAWRLAFPGRSPEEALACSRESVTLLALCLRPRGEHWPEDIAEIATGIGISPSALEAFLRQAQVAEKLSVASAADGVGNASLLAARDRLENE
jgi:hypothetical protein